MRLSGVFVVKSVEPVGDRFAAELVRRGGMGNLRVVLDEEVAVGDEFEFVMKSAEVEE